MRRGLSAMAIMAIAMGAPDSHPLAQSQNSVIVPGVQAPVPLPPPPPTNPRPPGSQPKLDTFGDKVTRCLHYGGSIGLQAGVRDAYSRACANN